ncbi:MAG: nicotinamide phosphoribosyltransferase domain-containing protein, partial [Proteobacteria bacterium]|nr:nicotinamide phosphoribosyltransferase domain-containing protein [Pseudomonadota bacterium]
MKIVPTLTEANKNTLELLEHPIFSADSYKFSHFMSLNNDVEAIYSHYLNRGDGTKKVMFVGLNDIIVEFLSKPLTQEHLYLVRDYCKNHGIPFNTKGYNKVVSRYNGLLPLKISAVPELETYPTNLPLFTIENNGGKDTVWCVGFVETLLMKVYYPSAVATKAIEVKEILQPYFDESSEAPKTAVDYAYVNFGNRAATCEKHATIGAMAHLHVFKATDGFRGVIEHNLRYGSSPTEFVSIPATEHSVVCSLLADYENCNVEERIEAEVDAVYTYVKNCIAAGYKTFAWVIDTTDPFLLTQGIAEHLDIADTLSEASATLVLRPDSGSKLDVLEKLYHILNDSGYCYLNKQGYMTSDIFSVIWGDGTTKESIEDMCNLWVTKLGASMDILSFGSGGDLINGTDTKRDTYGTAIKASAVKREGVWSPISKNPSTDSSKKSRGGRVVACKGNLGSYYIGDMDSTTYRPEDSIMTTVYKVG